MFLIRLRKKSLLMIILSLFIALLQSFSAAAVTGLTEDTQLYFTGSSSDPGTLYQDAMDGNLDAGMELCGVGSRYVGGFYAINTGSWEYVLVTYSPPTSALANAATVSGSCYKTTPGALTVSPSQLTTPSPYVYKAAFPGKLYIGYSTSSDPGTISNFEFGGSSAQLLGDYTVTRSFDQSTRTVSIGTPTVTFQTSSGSFSKSASDASFGINDERRMVIGFCTDEYGASCSDGNVYTSATFPVFSTGLAAADVNDQHTYTRYVVLNGLGKAMCIGANLKPSIDTVTPNPIYYSQNLTMTYTITNLRNTPYETAGGNVDVTTDFDVKLSIYNASNSAQVVYSNTRTITSTLAPNGEYEVTLVWPAYAHSGIYTVKVEADYGGDVVECNEADNSDTENFELKPITMPDIFIDDVETDIFDYPNVPYNLKFYFKNSDNRTLNNANVTIIEQNGLNLMAPTQLFNMTVDGSGGTDNTGLIVENRVSFVTDYYGNASFVFIPTYNKFYFPQYDYLEVEDHVGDYSLYFMGTQEDGESFVFITAGNVSFTYSFDFANFTYSGDYADKTLIEQNMTGQVLDFIYQTFTNFLETVLSEF